ncbi:MAG: hypothetical protein OXF22_10960 [Anaerolineaceae bacterium]|nr:hypothetical protein [Anaerolineaceae bacterium]
MSPAKNGHNHAGESALHRELKRHYSGASGEQEVYRHGYVIDVVRPDALVEIQTRNFAAIKQKLFALTAREPVLLVHPIARIKWLLRQDGRGAPYRRRKSPRRGRWEECFRELIRFPQLMAHPNLTLELALVEIEELRCDDGRGSWRRRGVSIQGRRLLRILEQRRLHGPGDFASLLPDDLPAPFTVRQLAQAAQLPRRLAGQMAYCLREMGALQFVGKARKAYQYQRVAGA